MIGSIEIEYEYTDIPYKALQMLHDISDISAYDFEVANKYTLLEKERIQQILLNEKLTKQERIYYKQQIEATGLSHPSLSIVTHLSFADKDNKGYCIVCNSNKIREIIFHYLVTTDKTQIWHNSLFDFKHLIFNVGKLPKNFIDTQLLAKSLLNDANNFKSNTGLKELMGWKYGTWALFDNDTITLENMNEQKVIKYACIDACATMSLYLDIKKDLDGWKI